MKSLHNKTTIANLVLLFFIALCAFSIVMALTLSQTSQQNTQNAPYIARFEIMDFTYLKITQKGITLNAKGEKARENANGDYELEALEILSQKDSSNNASLKADFALYNHASVAFPKGVTYIHNQSQFFSENALYFPESKTLEGFGNFTITGHNSKIYGQNIAYKDSKIYAKNIRGILKE